VPLVGVSLEVLVPVGDVDGVDAAPPIELLVEPLLVELPPALVELPPELPVPLELPPELAPLGLP
jgi:hypothetical protein